MFILFVNKPTRFFGKIKSLLYVSTFLMNSKERRVSRALSLKYDPVFGYVQNRENKVMKLFMVYGVKKRKRSLFSLYPKKKTIKI